MFIGEMAEAAGVGVETVRSYEREGLLPEPPRTDGGYSDCDPDAVRPVRELLDLRVVDPAACTEVEATARKKIADIERRIRELENPATIETPHE
jgi:DNA-binding transcriptional MerR regulator